VLEWLISDQWVPCQVVLGSGVSYSSPKPTAIWTNIRAFRPRTCSHSEHAARLGGKGDKRAPAFPELGIEARAAKRYTPEALHLALMSAMRLG
jgi:hypothetical protein